MTYYPQISYGGSKPAPASVENPAMDALSPQEILARFAFDRSHYSTLPGVIVTRRGLHRRCYRCERPYSDVGLCGVCLALNQILKAKGMT